MKRRLLGWVFTALGMVAIGWRSVGAEEPIDFLPSSGEVVELRLLEEPETYPGRKLFELIDGAGEIFLDYNFISAAAADYFEKRPEETIRVEIYQMKSPEDAFGIYRFYLPRKPEAIALGDEGSAYPGRIDFRKGKFYVKVYTFERRDSVLAKLLPVAQAVERKLEEAGVKSGGEPLLLRFLPRAKLVERSERFLHLKRSLDNLRRNYGRNIFSLERTTDMLLAEVRLGKERTAQIFLVKYPEEKKAIRAEEILRQAIAARDFKEKDLVARRLERYIFGTFDGNVEGIGKVIEEIHSNIQRELQKGQTQPSA